MLSLSQLVSAYKSGELERNAFWLAAQEKHRLLYDYQEQLLGSDLATIEIASNLIKVTTHCGIAMIWDIEDIRAAPNTLVNHGKHEALEAPYLLGAAKNARVVFDVGANVGFYSLYFAKLTVDGVVHAFEPVPSTYRSLIKNISLNNSDIQSRIVPNNFGFSERSGNHTFHVPKISGSGAASMVDLHPEEESNQVSCKLEVLDDYFNRSSLDRLDLIKIDVEGNELSVIRGGAETITKFKPVLFVELLRKWSRQFGYHPNEVISMLREIGYKCWTFTSNGMIPIEAIDEDTIQTNFMFVVPDKHPNPNTYRQD